MKKAEVKILIVEDDASQGKAIFEALKRAGFDPRLATNGDDALNAARQADYKLAIVDCLLPKTNGVELAGQIKKILGDQLVLYLMSGIYKDKAFIKEAITKTGAIDFVNKPLDIDRLVSLVEGALSNMFEADLPPLLESMMVKEVNLTDRLKALTSGTGLHGYDLPLVYSLIFGTSLTGQLSIMNSDGDTSVLTFSSGRLTQVHLKDSTSYFGVLLVEMGFTSHEEVSEVLSLQDKNPIGERLVAAHSLSPHAIRVVREEQMLIRLSKTVQDNFVDIAFTQTEVPQSDVNLEKDRFTQLLWDWICSKMSLDWMRGFYGRWLEHPIVLMDRASIERKLSVLPGLTNEIDPICKALGTTKTLIDTIEGQGLSDERVFPVLHLLMLEKLAHFGSKKSSAEDTTRKINRLKKLVAETASKNHFEILGISPKALEKEIVKSYMDLAKNFHPDRLEPTAPPELKKLTEQYFTRVTQAYETLKDPTKRTEYGRELVEGSAEKVLQNESIFDQGQIFLRKGKFSDALDCFQQLATQRQHRSDLSIYMAWAKMKVGVDSKRQDTFLKEIGEILTKVPPEERHSAPYFYTKALYYLQIGDLEKSKTNFKHAMVLDPNFVEARRDLAVVRNKLQSKTDSLGEFSSVVASFLGRKKSK